MGLNKNSDREVDLNEKEIKILANQLKGAYRKFKSYTYYNNYSAIDRLNLSEFEFKNFCNIDSFKFDEKRMDEFFENLAEKLIYDDLSEFIQDIGVISLPKRMVDKNKDYDIFTNFRPDNYEVNKIHYFIDLPIEGHIISVLWILRCGYILDDKLYHHCYSNRLNRNILNKSKNQDYLDSSTFLFYPYFKNYESWRDNALDEVQNILNKKQNSIMISLDIKDYFYSSRINFNQLFDDMKEAKKRLDKKKVVEIKSLSNLDNKNINFTLNKFVKDVFRTFHEKFSFKNDNETSDDTYMIPLGFLPSLIIANWNLQGFDQAILENIHPNYYGRYVDDILIVLPSHKKSDSHGIQHIEELDLEKIILKYLTPYGDPKNSIIRINRVESNEDIKYYGLNNLPILSLNSDEKYYYENFRIQTEKFRVYLFNHKNSKAMINKFRKEIKINSSEFKLLHGIKETFDNLEYNLYRIDYKESINKLNDIKDFRLNKFEASKILSRLIDSSKYSNNIDKNEVKFKKEVSKELMSAFNSDALSYINLWEKIFTYLYMNGEYTTLIQFIKHIVCLIENIEIESTEDKDAFLIFNLHDIDEIDNLKRSLKEFLFSSIVRVLSLKFDNNVYTVYKSLDKLPLDIQLNGNNTYDNFSDSFKIYINKLNDKSILPMFKFLFSSLHNNSLMRFPLQGLDNILNIGIESNKLELSYNLIKSENHESCKFNGFYPRYVKLYEFILNEINKDIFNNYDSFNLDDAEDNGNQDMGDEDDSLNRGSDFDDAEDNGNQDMGDEDDSLNRDSNLDDKNCPDHKYLYHANEEYSRINFPLDNQQVIRKFVICEKEFSSNYTWTKIDVNPNKNKDTLLVGLVNTKLNKNYYENRIKDNPVLTFNRFDKIKKIINEAIEKKVEFLVMPELYIPYEWIDKLIEVSRNHQMVMIFGVEYIVHKDNVKNYIMVSLPYKEGKYKTNIITYRLKNHYAPDEVKCIHRFNKTCDFSNEQTYDLYNWNGICFAPYCCYEIADINARSLFKGECDIVTVSELNKDVKYFNSICESLARDLYCYCVTSNTSEYGGNSIIQPSSSESKYLIQLKGGDNDYIVTHKLDIADLKDKRSWAYTADFSKTKFKPLPPGLNYNK